MPTLPDPHFFQTASADIEGNTQLREPQREAHRAVRQHFATSREPVILQIPVGCGKTGVMATLPFGIARGRVLIIAPNVTIRNGIAAELDVASPKCFWRKSGAVRDFSLGPYRAVLDGVDANLHDCNASQFVVTNIQQLASSADRWLPQFSSDYFDMILVDEGHHNVAASWTRVFERFPNAKVVSLTATPFRGDGVRPTGKVIYKYPFTRAMVRGYIKQVHSRNVAPSELLFTVRDEERRLTLADVMELREEAWFRRGVALSIECNRNIVDASLKYLEKAREATGYPHQLIAVACSVDHARQIRSLYEERGYSAAEVFAEMPKDEQENTIDSLRRGRLDCIVQVQMLGEGFDHPPLSVAAVFRPFRSLSPYIQFVGRIMRVIHQNKPDHPDNQGYLVSHVGLSNDEHWDDFRELDFDDQELIHQWIATQGHDDADEGKGGRPRRFDSGMLVDNEIIGEFVKTSFLDPTDDRVLDEMLNTVVAGIRLGELFDRETLRSRLMARKQQEPEVTPPLIVQPQRLRVEARRRLNERLKAVAARIVSDLKLTNVGLDVGRAMAGVSGRKNLQATVELLNIRLDELLGIGSDKRGTLSPESASTGFAALDALGDGLRNEIRAGLAGPGYKEVMAKVTRYLGSCLHRDSGEKAPLQSE
jgi:DNA repair protein RadD